ncbi:MAG TPA: aminodeoxychorismate lyase [Oceanospirillales bacterium]|nr:aminodeoxychorismate lyase [Oceanospirillales bacterium]
MKFYTSFTLATATCLTNRACSYGDGVFETILVKNHDMPLWALHYHRLTESLVRLNIVPIAKEELYAQILAMIDDDDRYVAKLMVYRDGQRRGYSSDSNVAQYVITVNPSTNTPNNQELAISQIKLAKQPSLAGLKHLNRLEQVLAAQELTNSPYNDALMLDSKGHVIETISKNIVLVRKHKLYTPKLNKCGVYGVALRWLQAQGIQIKWKKIEFKSLSKYDGLMVCNSINGFAAITEIENKLTFNKDLAIIKKIQQKWSDQVEI